MSPLLQICAIIVTVSIAAIAIGVLRAMKSFTEATEEFRKTTDVARASIAEIDVVTRQIRELAQSVEGVVAPLQRASSRVENLTQRAVNLSSAVIDQIESPITQTVALMTGVRTGTRTLFQRIAGRLAGRMGHATSNGGYRHE